MIKLFLTDVDGCLTDGVYQSNEKGVISKNFYTRDFAGLSHINSEGVTVGVVTLASDRVIREQCHRGAKYIEIHAGIDDKLRYIDKEYINPGRFIWSEIAYIGDDLNDLDLLAIVGFPACPADAHLEVINCIRNHPNGIHLKLNGGRGCVRELADIVMTLNNGGQKNEW